MRFIRVSAATLNQTPLAWDQNRAHILSAIAKAREAGASLLCLPELCITGYSCEDAFHSPGVARRAMEQLLGLLPETKGMIVAFGLPVFHQNALYNTACLVADGEILGFVAKQNLAAEGIHYEPRWFQPWLAGRRSTLVVAGRSYPFGDVTFSCGGLVIGFEICEDAWSAGRPGAALCGSGVDVILNPSASHFAFGKHDVRKRFVLEGSRAFGVAYVYSNLLGNEAGRAIYDGGALIAAAGEMLAEDMRFSFDAVRVCVAAFDLDRVRMQRARASGFRVRTAAEGLQPVLHEFHYPEIEPAFPRIAATGWERGPHRKEEEFARAVSLGLFDYMRKSHSRGFVVSLSGGADSSAIATLIHLLVRFGQAELGPDGFRRRAGMADLPDDPRGCVEKLLCTVYQSTRNSSDITRSAAREVAEAIGAHHCEIEVQAMVDGYLDSISQALGVGLTWEKHDLALQNIQARARGPSAWLLANLRGALLLATSNRSEAAVGYATMDGDTCGGLSPIAGIDKAYLRRWLTWMEATGPEGVGPLPALHAVTSQAPTAELRPPDKSQTDEADLMPYTVLDAIERAAIRDKKEPAEILPYILSQFPDYSREQLAFWIERFFTLWCRNQWKRERFAPSFHLDDENLDPKTWCRFPILSGGFEKELADLRSRV